MKRLWAFLMIAILAATAQACDPDKDTTAAVRTQDTSTTTSTSTTTTSTTTSTTAPPTTTTTAAPVRTTTTAAPRTTTTVRRTTTTTAAAAAPASTSKCHPSYQGTCIPPDVEDADCAGGSGNGPWYVKEKNISVVGPDVFGLDADHDGIGCES